jgi:hypothetical protein
MKLKLELRRFWVRHCWSLLENRVFSKAGWKGGVWWYWTARTAKHGFEPPIWPFYGTEPSIWPFFPQHHPPYWQMVALNWTNKGSNIAPEPTLWPYYGETFQFFPPCTCLYTCITRTVWIFLPLLLPMTQPPSLLKAPPATQLTCGCPYPSIPPNNCWN